MFRLPRRLTPALALVAVAATALPGGAAGGYASVAVSDADVYVASVKVPGGMASVSVFVIDQTGADVYADSSPGAEPGMYEYAWACVRVERGKLKDFGCDEVDFTGASAESDLSAGRIKVNVPSLYGKGRLTADVTLAATGPAETTPNHGVVHSLPDFVFADVMVSEARPAAVTGTFSSTRAGGGKATSTTYGVLAREKWLEGYAVTF